MRLIDADALCEVLRIPKDDSCTYCSGNNNGFCNRGPEFVNACEAIADAPTIEERQEGVWLGKHIPYTCSICGKKYEAADKFCRNCGSIMKREGTT